MNEETKEEIKDVTVVEPAPVYGIEDLWKIICLLVEGGNIAGNIIAADPSLKWYDRYLFPMVKITDDVIAMFTVNYKLILPEIKDLSDAGKDELIKRVCDKFDIPQDNVEQFIEKIMASIFKLADIIKEIVEFAQMLKK
jgi:hypothetical protein